MGVKFLNQELVNGKVGNDSDKDTLKTVSILAELGHAPGAFKRVMPVSPKAVEEKSRESIANALLVIKEISEQIAETMEETPAGHRPSQMQMAFNLRLTATGDAVITKSEKDLNLKVTLVWKNEGKEIL